MANILIINFMIIRINHIFFIILGLLAIFSGLSIFTSPVIAANYGGFGSSYSAVINPKDAVLNSETAKSAEVQAGIDGLKAVTNVVKTLKDDIVSQIIHFSFHFPCRYSY